MCIGRLYSATANEKCNKRLAACFVLYMYCGSCFCRSRFVSQAAGERMYLHYCELKNSDRDCFEQEAIAEIGRLDQPFLERLGSLECEVAFTETSDSYELEFLTGGFEALRATLWKTGKFRISPVYMGVGRKQGSRRRA